MTQPVQSETEAARAASARQRIALGAVIAGISIAALFYVFKDRTGFSLSAFKELASGEPFRLEPLGKVSSQKASQVATNSAGVGGKGADGAFGNFIYDVQGEGQAPNNNDERKAFLPAASPAELLAVAQAAKDSGFVIQGVTQCIWTRRQREIFGDATSPARKVIESIYTECRSRDDCPNVRGYPTWSRSGTQFPGYRDLDAIKVMVKDAGAQPRMPMLQGAPEPIDDVMPEDRAALTAPPAATQPASSAAPSAAAVSSSVARSELAAMIRSISSEVVDELLKSRAPATTVEHVRGVSNFPPLNVPDMPGTKPWNVPSSLFVDQAAQGNVPRRSEELDESTIALAHQMAFTFQQIAYDERRDPNSSDFSRVQLPASSYISSSENPLDDKRIVSQ